MICHLILFDYMHNIYCVYVICYAMLKLCNSSCGGGGGGGEESKNIYHPSKIVMIRVMNSIHVHHICKFQEDPINTEWITLLTVKQRIFQQSRGRNSKVKTRSGQVSNLFEILSITILSASFRKFPSKLNKLCWLQSQTKASSTIKGTQL